MLLLVECFPEDPFALLGWIGLKDALFSLGLAFPDAATLDATDF